VGYGAVAMVKAVEKEGDDDAGDVQSHHPPVGSELQGNIFVIRLQPEQVCHIKGAAGHDSVNRNQG
jgi:hypothetical protein